MLILSRREQAYDKRMLDPVEGAAGFGFGIGYSILVG
jgi:hypothetical protein